MKLVVAGSINQDIVLVCERQPMVGETLSSLDASYLAGGKGANQAVAAARAGAETHFVGAVGDDEIGKSLTAGLEAENISVSGISIKPDIKTGLAVVIVAEENNSIVLHAGANAELNSQDVERFLDETELKTDDFVLAQLETPQSATLALFQKAHEVGATSALNPAPAATLEESLIVNTDYLIVNEIELEMLTIAKESDPKKLITQVQSEFGVRGVICTLGKNGVVACEGKATYELPAVPIEKVVDTTGAGDCFVGVFSATLMKEGNFKKALESANLAAAISTQTLGAQASYS